MKIKLPSNMRAGAPMGAGTPDPSEPATTPLGEPATAVEPVVPSGGSAPAVIGQVLPMYFVGDESHSMAGDPIAAVNQGLIDLRDEVASTR